MPFLFDKNSMPHDGEPPGFRRKRSRIRCFAGYARTPHPVGTPDERGRRQKAPGSPSPGCPACTKEGMFSFQAPGLKSVPSGVRFRRSVFTFSCLRIFLAFRTIRLFRRKRTQRQILSFDRHNTPYAQKRDLCIAADGKLFAALDEQLSARVRLQQKRVKRSYPDVLPDRVRNRPRRPSFHAITAVPYCYMSMRSKI